MFYVLVKGFKLLANPTDRTPLSLGQKRFVLVAKTGFYWRARHPPAILSQ
jgi:hypothetical protein